MPLTIDIEAALGRRESPAGIDAAQKYLKGKRVLITGAKGSVGNWLQLRDVFCGSENIYTDVGDLDVTGDLSLLTEFAPDVIFHLAGAKQAPQGEYDPEECISVNALGTQRLLSATNARVITASTCKAALPETCYGASKLLAERLTLNAGGTVCRFYNIADSSRNVFETWAAIPEDEPIPYTPCFRYFISMNEAISLLLDCVLQEPGRYCFNPGNVRSMAEVASSVYPDRELVEIPLRRGDRVRECMSGKHETVVPVHGRIKQIINPHD